ncbi:uncharacterized protein LOC108087112 isoform X2 [Drosophila ficusphila]|uniref:uncharacterized protein LOC108087112 isoform X2 n=1 Tax=Drosophila ficusphila TaxID=30025 RepID=UPI0007E87722|nr:uncharacterized protein LOC108087112 isoform X2 [Drosophila ficusphila]
MKRQIIVFVPLLILPDITHPLEGPDDFEIPEEVTTLHENLGPVLPRRIAGRTRETRVVTADENNATGKMIENYCCFWIYQAHPPIPHTWKHMAVYPFDFQFNGQFVKNRRHNETEVPPPEKQI